MKIYETKWLFLLCCMPLLFAAGCTTTPPLQAITEPGKRWQLNGFSVIPPASKGWYWVGREGQAVERFFNVTYVKRMLPATALAKAEANNLGTIRFDTAEDLLESVRSSKIMQEGPRQKNVESSFWPDRATKDICVRWDFKALDDGSPHYVDILFVIDSRGVACVHPLDESVVVMASVSRRTPQGQHPFSSNMEGDQFIDSLRMSEIRR